MAPGYHDGIVYVSTVPGNNAKFYGGGGVGILWALDAATGRKLWQFNTAPKICGPRTPNVNSGGGVWYAPAFDEQGSSTSAPATPRRSPAPNSTRGDPAGPVPDLYTDSLVKLNATHRQAAVVLPADTARPLRPRPAGPADPGERRGPPVVIAAGKSGM